MSRLLSLSQRIRSDSLFLYSCFCFILLFILLVFGHNFTFYQIKMVAHEVNSRQKDNYQDLLLNVPLFIVFK